jgi:PAS domain S-box-containing protein
MPASGLAASARLRALARLNRRLSTSLDLRVVLTGVARSVASLLRAPVVSFWVVDEATRRVTVRAFSHPAVAADLPVKSWPYGQDGVGWVAEHGRPLGVDDVLADGRFAALDWWKRHRLRSFYGVPVVLGGARLAVLALHGRRPFRLSVDDRDLLQGCVSQAAIALAHARLRASRAEAEMAEQRYRLMFERNMAGVFRTTREGRVLECNESTARILGYGSREEVLALNTRVLWVDAADRDRLLRRLDAGQVFSSEEIRLRRKDGGEVWVLVNVNAVMDGTHRCLEGMIIDVTHRKRVEAAERALESLRSVSSLASAAAHEINNPLTVVMGSFDLVARRVDDARVREWVDRGRDAVRRIRDVIDRMSRITRLQVAEEWPGLPPMLDIRGSSAEPPAPARDR